MERTLIVVLVITGCASPAKQRHPDAKRVVDACLAVSAMTVPVDQARAHFDKVNGICADVYVEQRCRDAFKAVAGATDRTSAVAGAMTTCRDVYCPLLPGDKPVMCTPAGQSLAPEAGLTAWHALFAAIYRFDLGETEGTRLATGHQLN